MIYKKGMTNSERIEESRKYTETLVEQVREKWKDHYDFSKITYTYGNGLATIISGIFCKYDGNIFHQSIQNLLNGIIGCEICKKRNREKEILDNLYTKFGKDYIFTISTNKESGFKSKNRIIIKVFCKKHNTFHFKDYFELLEDGITGCKECRLDKQYEEFLKDLHKMYGNLYTVSRENFGGKRRRVVTVHCNEHNIDFTCLARTLLSGENICPKCDKLKIFNQQNPTKEELELIKELAKQGYPATKIGIEIKRDVDKVRKILQSNSITISNLFIPKLKELIKLLEVDKLSQIEAGRLLGMKRADVYNAVRLHNIKIFHTEDPKWKSFSKEWWRNKIINEGLTLEDLGRELNTTKTVINNYLKNYMGLKVIDLIAERKQLNIEKIKKLAKSNLSAEEIAQRINIPYSTVKRYSRENDIELISSKSNGEILVENYLILNKIKFNRNTTIHEIKGRYSNYVNIDFILENNIWIEYDGSQHFKRYSRFHPTNEDFSRQVQRDINVVNYCKLNNILLIRIPYTLNTYDRISNFLDKILKENKDPEDLINLESLYERPIEEILKEL